MDQFAFQRGRERAEQVTIALCGGQYSFGIDDSTSTPERMSKVTNRMFSPWVKTTNNG
ncbi:hypothetical protein ACW2Q0_18210 [Nocardia sp. R16R-3T]